MWRNIAFFAFALSITLVSCNKDDSIEPVSEDTDLVVEEDLGTIEYIEQTTAEFIDETIETRDPGVGCVEVTFQRPPGEFPNKITFDFGDGCQGPHGHTLSGIITVNQSAPMREPGALRTVTFVDFSFDSIAIAGTKHWENTSTGTGEGVSFTRTVEMELTFPDGSTASWEGTYYVVQVEGADTPERWDDVFETTGSTSGVSRNSVAFTSTITEPLIRKNTCRWTVDGVIEIESTVENEVRVRTIDYGHPNDGECDRLALVTLADGTEKEIIIHRRRW